MIILCCQVRFFFLRILWAFCPLYTDLWITVEAKDVIECVYQYSCKYICNVFVIDFLALASDGVFCTVIMCH